MKKRSLPKKPSLIVGLAITALILSVMVIFSGPQSSPSPELTSLPTAQPTEWVTYTHPDYHYSFQYPTNWELTMANEGNRKGEIEIVYPLTPTENPLINIAIPVKSDLTLMEYDQQDQADLPPGLIVAPKYWTVTLGENEWLFFLDEESSEPYNPLVAYTKHNGLIYRLYLTPYHPSSSFPETEKTRQIFEQVVASFQPAS